VKGANWRAPEGPGSSIEGKEDHPVVHVAYAGLRELEGARASNRGAMEYAARGGRGPDEDWTMAYDKEGKPLANSWQGIFPVYNTEEDGYAGTAPVGCFPPNPYGLYDMLGNVWEVTGYWYVPGHGRVATLNPSCANCDTALAPEGCSPGSCRTWKVA
jgi:formylglycine-generating enzyme required for sulfatase activity